MSSTNPSNWSKIITIWDVAGPQSIPIIQKAIQQRKDSCAYASIGSHIEYNVRIAYANQAYQGIPLPSERLVDDKKWEMNATAIVGDTVRDPWLLLKDAKVNGVPLFNGLTFKIDEHYHFKKCDPVAMKNILQSCTLLVVFEVRDDYSRDGEIPYMGRGTMVKDFYDKPYTHAVVVVGEYKDDSLFAPGETKEPLWVYQNSDGDKDKSFLGNGLNVVRHGLLIGAYCGETYPTNVLLDKIEAGKVKSFRKTGRVLPEILTKKRKVP
ncbi:hypothetical protein RND81_14G087400 [Saponaria officinalis]|uniref:Uncharacterized protein n=1 Tax=Saponaria officinalis TaxID=3572 RepID=A0AAW1GRT2_SAPOF